MRFSIGEFARHGRVSVRMLRHYDAIGLLRPACVDPVTGYRSYEVSQLAELNRLGDPARVPAGGLVRPERELDHFPAARAAFHAS